MIHYLAEKTARHLTKGDESADYDVLLYGYELIFQEVAVVLLAMLIALPLGLLVHLPIAIATYYLLRRYAGGTHAQHRALCIATSVLALFGPAFVFVHTELRLSLPAMLLLFAADAALLLLYAPADTEIRPVQDPAVRKRMKGMALLVLVAYLLFALLINRWRSDFASLVLVVATIVCCLTHPLAYRVYGCKKSA